MVKKKRFITKFMTFLWLFRGGKRKTPLLRKTNIRVMHLAEKLTLGLCQVILSVIIPPQIFTSYQNISDIATPHPHVP